MLSFSFNFKFCTLIQPHESQTAFLANRADRKPREPSKRKPNRTAAVLSYTLFWGPLLFAPTCLQGRPYSTDWQRNDLHYLSLWISGALRQAHRLIEATHNSIYAMYKRSIVEHALNNTNTIKHPEQCTCMTCAMPIHTNTSHNVELTATAEQIYTYIQAYIHTSIHTCIHILNSLIACIIHGDPYIMPYRECTVTCSVQGLRRPWDGRHRFCLTANHINAAGTPMLLSLHGCSAHIPTMLCSLLFVYDMS